MPPFKIRPPGVRHTMVYSRAFKEIQQRRMALPNWPPPDASPLHPIEPWGKQFMVFNTHKAQPLPTSSIPYGTYHLPPMSDNSGGSHDIPSIPVLCVTDFARRPLMYLTHDDFQSLVPLIDYIKESLKKFEEKMPNENPEEVLYKQQRLIKPERHYGMQRMPGGNHTSYGMKRGAYRKRKV